ncbi:hypothetical protein PM082_014170 [Marasmius tenuissimus]|nr:hypothetical protein PM082_014170 [Marasmius tenuissimus]
MATSSCLVDFPTEILLLIFKEASTIGYRTDISSKNLCGPSPTPPSSTQSLSHHPLQPTPLNIAGVCLRWREITLNTPQLWSSFALSLDPDRLGTHLALYRLGLYLSRSKDSPLMIRVHGSLEGTSDVPGVDVLIRKLCGSIGRWKALDVTNTSLPEGWDSMFQSFFQLLGASKLDLKPQLLSSLTLSEPLHTDNYKATSSGSKASPFDTLFLGITSLTVTPRLHLHRLWHGGLLNRCSATLTDLTIELLGVPNETSLYHWQVLPSLRSLTVVVKWRRGSPKDALTSIFVGLICPELKKMELRIEMEEPSKLAYWPGPVALEFLSAVGLPLGVDRDQVREEELEGGGLEELLLVDVKMSAQELADLREAVPGARIYMKSM